MHELYIIYISHRFIYPDDRSCADDPCFPGVECMDVDPTMVDYTQSFVRLFECGDCPEDYSGDGIDCIGKYTNHLDEPKEMQLLLLRQLLQDLFSKV